MTRDHTFPTIPLEPLAGVAGGQARLVGAAKPYTPPRYNPRIGPRVAPARPVHPESYVQPTVSDPMPGTNGHVPRGTLFPKFPEPTFRFNALGYFDD